MLLNTRQSKLKEATVSSHRQIEHNAFAKAVLQEKAPIEKYVEWLIRFYGFYYPLENFIQKSNFLSLERIRLKERLKVPLLSRDLVALGQSGADINQYVQCRDLPRLSDEASLLGYLYVVEGSSLGGQFIVKKLRQNYDFKGDQGCRFFNSYGDRTDEMWQEFCRFLNEYPLDEKQEKAALQTARDTFEKLNTWLNERREK